MKTGVKFKWSVYIYVRMYVFRIHALVTYVQAAGFRRHGYCEEVQLLHINTDRKLCCISNGKR